MLVSGYRKSLVIIPVINEVGNQESSAPFFQSICEIAQSHADIGAFAFRTEVKQLPDDPEPTSITDSYALLKALSKSPDYDFKHTTVNVVSNKVDNQAEGKLVYNKLSIVSEKFLNVNLNFLGYIPSDSNLMKAVMQQKPVSMVYENSKASFAFKRIAEELVKEDFSGKGKEKVGISQVFLNIFRVKSGK